MPRVLHILATPVHGGVESYFANLCIALQEAGVAQEVVLLHHDSQRERLKNAGVITTEVLEGDYTHRAVRRVIAKAVADFRPNIVQTWMAQATEHLPKGKYLHVGWLRGYQNLRYYRPCDHLIGITKGVVQSVIEQGWPADRIHLLRGFTRSDTAAPLPRASLETPDDAPLIFCAGMLHDDNAFDVMLKALAFLPQHYLWVSGEGEAKPLLHDLAVKNGVADRVRWLPWADEKASLLAACDVVVVPSRHEPFALMPLVAWAQRRPLILSNAVAPRVGAIHGENALVFPVDDAASLARCLRQLENDSSWQQTIVAGGSARYEAHYTPAIAVKNYIDFYQRILHEGKARRSALPWLREMKERVLGLFS
ncbi:MAG: glycosyltransferase [Holosporales bacterium]|jgi:glycosyltransferase involved in cell wall biosynthesis